MDVEAPVVADNSNTPLFSPCAQQKLATGLQKAFLDGMYLQTRHIHDLRMNANETGVLLMITLIISGYCGSRITLLSPNRDQEMKALFDGLIANLEGTGNPHNTMLGAETFVTIIYNHEYEDFCAEKSVFLLPWFYRKFKI